MSIWLRYLLVALAGYLLGNLSTGILISKAYGVMDIRRHGSGNAGSTNVLRTLGWVPSVLTLAGDCLKGYLAARLGGLVAGEIGLLIGGCFAVIGHDFPVFLRFRGGKGIATSLGMIIAVNPLIALILAVLALGIAALTRYMSLGSIIGAAAYPLLVALLMRGGEFYTARLISALFAAALAIFCHRKNIVRLLHHAENRLDFEKINQISHRIKNFRK